MKNSFKDVLYQVIKARGIISINDLEYICKKQNKKFDNGTRTLRKLIEEGRVTTKRDEKKIILAYIFVNIEPIGVPRAAYELQQELFKVRQIKY